MMAAQLGSNRLTQAWAQRRGNRRWLPVCSLRPPDHLRSIFYSWASCCSATVTGFPARPRSRGVSLASPERRGAVSSVPPRCHASIESRIRLDGCCGFIAGTLTHALVMCWLMLPLLLFGFWANLSAIRGTLPPSGAKSSHDASSAGGLMSLHFRRLRKKHTKVQLRRLRCQA